jgi:hypothetical protein
VVRESVVGASLGQLGLDVNAAAAGGGFRRPEAQLVREELVLDEKGFKDIAKELGRSLERVAKIREDSAKRLEKSGAESSSGNVVMMLFEAGAANGSSAK